MEEEHKYRESAGSRKAMTSPPLKPLNQPLSKSETCVFGASGRCVLTWWSSSWFSVCWKRRSGAPPCWAGEGGVWRVGALGFASRAAAVCWGTCALPSGTRCGCFFPTWTRNIPGTALLRPVSLARYPGGRNDRMTPATESGVLYRTNGWCDQLTCSWEMGVSLWLDSSISVQTSVRRSVLQPIRIMRVLGQKSIISAFHCR